MVKEVEKLSFRIILSGVLIQFCESILSLKTKRCEINILEIVHTAHSKVSFFLNPVVPKFFFYSGLYLNLNNEVKSPHFEKNYSNKDIERTCEPAN